MPTTPVLALPYPALSDTADVPRDIQALAVKLDGLSSLQPPIITSLPGSPVDGQEIYFQNTALATAGVIWHLRYRAASASTYKWEVIGGGILTSIDGTARTTTSTTYVALTGAPSITLPLAGDYEVTHGFDGQPTVAGGVQLQTFTPAGGLGDASIRAGGSPSVANTVASAHRGPLRIDGLAAGAISLLNRTTSTPTNTAQFNARELTVRPIRVG